MAEETVNLAAEQPVAGAGSAGLETQHYGQATTVDGLSAPNGGVGAGNLFEVEVDKQLFEFESDDTPLMQLMLAAKRVSVQSPKVQHFQIDEEKTMVEVASAVTASSDNTQFILPVSAGDKKLCQVCGTLSVRGVDGYDRTGQNVTPGVNLMLYVIGRDKSTGNPIVTAMNGPKAQETDAECTIPEIPAGSVIDILGNALHETQRKVEPDSTTTVPEMIFLQKRGMNRVVSDYFESQRKRVPFTNALLAERDLRKFKRAGNRTLWASVQGELTVQDEDTGLQKVLTTKGILYQFKRVLERSGAWTYRQFVSLAKMFFTGVDVPQSAICLCGKGFLENIQCIDFSDHPEVKIEVKTNSIGWSVTQIHTVFGDFQFKWEPTLDKLGFENSAAIIGEGRLVHYQRTTEHSEKERIEGHEANRESLIVWDALALKGSCHVFVNGESDANVGGEDTINFLLWDKEEAPEAPEEGAVYFLGNDCAGIDEKAQRGELWQYSEGKWSKYNG